MDETKVTLRFPTELHAALVEMAKQEQRSLNGQIVYLLQNAIILRTMSGRFVGVTDA